MDQLFNKLIEDLPIPAFIIKQNHKISHWNKALEELVGIKADEVIDTNRHVELFSKEGRPCMADLLLDGAIQNNIDWSKSGYLRSSSAKEAYEITDYFQLIENGTWLHQTAEVFRDIGGDVVGVIQYLEDITKSKLTEDTLQEMRKKLEKENEQQQKLLTFMRRPDIAGPEITSFFIEECIKISESKIGFFGRVNDDATVMTAHLWSEQAMEVCAVDFKPMEFNIVTAGIWAESIRTHMTFVDNDFEKPDPRKKGFPIGHAPIQRYLSIPVVNNGKVVAVLGLANKSQDYTNDDIVQLSIFIESVVALFQKKETEKNLRESEERYRTIFNNTGTAMTVIEEDSTLSLINTEAEKLFGYSKQEVEGKKKWADFVTPDDVERMEEYHSRRRIDPAGVPSVYEFSLVDKQGAVRNISVTISIIPGTKKSVASLLDITERKRAEEELRESQEYLKVLFSSSRIPLIVMDAETGVYIDCNAAAVQIYGYTNREEVLGKTPLDVSAPIQYNGADSVTEAIKHNRACIENGSHIFEWLHQRPDGQMWDADVHLMFFQHRGKSLIQFTLQDITERKKAAQVLWESESKFRTLFEAASDAIFLMGQNFFIACNQKALEMFGCTKEQIIGQTPARFSPEIQPDGRYSLEKSQEKIDAAMKGQPQSFEWRNSRYDGTLFDAEVSLNVFVAAGKNYLQVLVHDITERKKAEEELKKSEQRFRDLTEHTSDWVWEVDANGVYTYSNLKVKEILGYDPDEIIGKTPFELMTPEEVKRVVPEFQAIIKALKPFSGLENTNLHKNGQQVMLETNGVPILDSLGQLQGYRGIDRDITERKRNEEKIQHLATHDSLTGLPNRLMFAQILNHSIQSARRNGRQLAVLFIDLDRFKIINDTKGHEAGDQLLQEIAMRYTQILRAADVISRQGGDEFVILIEDVHKLSDLQLIANNILASTYEPVVLLGDECRVTASIGISLYPQDGEDDQTLMKHADMAMYYAKEEGKNGFQFYSEEIQSQATGRLAIETNLRLALERKELSLHYQAKINLKTGIITGVEALLRWQNPHLGSVTPTQFIPVAEETGLIISIGKWVLKTACNQNVAWQKQGLPAVCISVNLSLRQLTDNNLIDDIKVALNDSGMAPNLLELEITESMIMSNPTKMMDVLGRIKNMGVRLAIDDFGTGYSSLAQLKHFPINTLKIDRSFIRNVPENAEDKAITHAIITMGETLGFTVVAEGVETIEQMSYLKDQACDEMQGYYFSRPVVPEQFADLLRKQAGTFTE